jgi:acetyl-CoA carboxylase carboxyl transferase subunit beta
MAAWFRKEKTPKVPVEKKRVKMPEGLWVKCDNCAQIIYKKEIARNRMVCPKCDYHFRISAMERLQGLFDGGRFDLLDSGISPLDALQFKDSKPYTRRLAEYQERTGLKDAVLNARGLVDGYDVLISAMEYSFMGGSMGSVVGEKVTRACERALKEHIPLIVISCSGGARMQEGALSLMQMAKISSMLSRMDEAGVPYISVLTDPTTGGVTASYAMLGDLNLAEPRALIGFAGPRVIEQTIRQTLPEGFQRSEFLLEKGMIDMIVPRVEMKRTLSRCLEFFGARRVTEGVGEEEEPVETEAPSSATRER